MMTDEIVILRTDFYGFSLLFVTAASNMFHSRSTGGHFGIEKFAGHDQRQNLRRFGHSTRTGKLFNVPAPERDDMINNFVFILSNSISKGKAIMHQSGRQYGAQEFERMIVCNQMANAAHI